jgi:hypothetical protein
MVSILSVCIEKKMLVAALACFAIEIMALSDQGQP